jgi:AcrR family transcriptional regulator
MRRSSAHTKAAILAAARERFGAAGFHGATIRAIAADAGIDPAMVMRYFGSKDQLFAAAAKFDLRFPDLSAVESTHLGTALISHFLDRWEGDEALIVLLRSSTTNAEAVERMHQIFVGQLQPMVATLVANAAAVRAGLIATQILGLALCRYVLRLPPIAAMAHEDIVALIGPTIQRYFDAPVELSGSRGRC